VTRPVELQPVEENIRAMGFDTWSLAGEMKDLRKVFVLLDALLAAVGAVALVVAGLGIVNTLLMAVLERYTEIGACKALGASDGDIRVLFLSEAGLVGVAGGLGGIALGRGVSWIIQIGVNAYARSKGVQQPIDAFAFPIWLLAGALLFAIGASVLSGVYPASRAARVDPIRALRGE
jgi:ABC-type antimicrobial peptide transport system permease subunit